MACALLVAACGGSGAPATTPRVVRAPEPEAAPAEKQPSEPDLSAVPAPDGLVLVGRARTLDDAHGLLANNSGARFERDLIGGDDSERGRIAAAHLSGLVRWDAPAAVALAFGARIIGPPRVLMVRSVSVPSVATVKDGVPGTHLRDDGSAYITGTDCEVVPVPSEPPARLICGSQRARRELLPYVQRTLPRLELSGILRVQVFPEPGVAPLERYRSFLMMGADGPLERQLGPRLARALEPVVDAGSEQLVQLLRDAKLLDVSVNRREDRSVTVDAKLVLQSAGSPAAAALERMRPRVAVPELAARIPAEASSVTYVTATDAEATRGMRAVLRDVSERYARSGLDPIVHELLAKTFVPEDTGVIAHGPIPERFPRAASRPQLIRLYSVRLYGWTLVGVNRPAAEVKQHLDAGMKAYNSGPLNAWAYRAMPRLCDGLPKIRTRPYRGKGVPAGSVRYDMIIDSATIRRCADRSGTATGKAADPIDVAVLMVPDGERTWVGTSAAPRFLEALMHRVVAGPPQRDHGFTEPALIGGYAPIQRVSGFLSPGLSYGFDTVRWRLEPAGALEWRLHAELGAFAHRRLTPDTSP